MQSPTTWRHEFRCETGVSAERLWDVIANVAAWPSIDSQIDELVLDGEVARGTEFTLKPRGGPRIRFIIARFEAPSVYADRCRLFGATMTTVHRLVQQNACTRIEVEIEIRGPLALFWGFAVGKRHASGLPAQTETLVAAARDGRPTPDSSA